MEWICLPMARYWLQGKYSDKFACPRVNFSEKYTAALSNRQISYHAPSSTMIISTVYKLISTGKLIILCYIAFFFGQLLNIYMNC